MDLVIFVIVVGVIMFGGVVMRFLVNCMFIVCVLFLEIFVEMFNNDTDSSVFVCGLDLNF